MGLYGGLWADRLRRLISVTSAGYINFAAKAVFAAGANVSEGQDLNMANNSRIMLGDSLDGFGIDVTAGAGSLMYVTNNVESSTNYFSPAYNTFKCNTFFANSAYYGSTSSVAAPMIAGLTVPNGKTIVTPAIVGLGTEALKISPGATQSVQVLANDGSTVKWTFTGAGYLNANGSGPHLSCANIDGIAGSTLTITAGATAGDDIILKEGTGDGSTERILMLGGGYVTINGPTGTGSMNFGDGISYVSVISGTARFSTITNTAADGPPLFPKGLSITGLSTIATPANGVVSLYADTDDNVFKIVDQAGTHAAITHAAIDIVA